MPGTTAEPLHPCEVKPRPTLEPEIRLAMLAKIAARADAGSPDRRSAGQLGPS